MNTTRRRAQLLLTGALTVLLVSGLLVSRAAPAAPAPTPPPPGKMTLRLGHIFPVDNSWAKASVRFTELAAQKSNGRLEIKVFPASQLGNERELEEGLQLGNLDFTFGGPGVLTNFDPKIGVFDLPFLFRNYAHANKVMDGPIGDEIWASMRTKAGIRVLASGAQGFRYVVTRDKPINKVEDLKGLKIRTPEAQTYLKTFQLLGANPVGVPWGETYTALQTGVVDGMEGVPEIILTAKMYEAGKNAARTNHILATLQIMVSEKTYQKLSPDLQKAVQDAAKEAWGAARAAAEKANADAEKELQAKGLKFTDPDLAALQKAVSPWWTEWGEKNQAGDWIKKVQELK